MSHFIGNQAKFGGSLFVTIENLSEAETCSFVVADNNIFTKNLAYIGAVGKYDS